MCGWRPCLFKNGGYQTQMCASLSGGQRRQDRSREEMSVSFVFLITCYSLFIYSLSIVISHS